MGELVAAVPIEPGSVWIVKLSINGMQRAEAYVRGFNGEQVLITWVDRQEPGWQYQPSAIPVDRFIEPRDPPRLTDKEQVEWTAKKLREEVALPWERYER